MDNDKTLLVIFGITGDLAQRKLLPALCNIIQHGDLQNTDIIGISRREISAKDIVAKVPPSTPDTVKSTLEKILTVFSMDVAESDDYRKLRQTIEGYGESTQVIFYLSVPPQASVPIVELLGQNGLNGPNIKVLLEKPFGVDLASAEEAIERIGRYFDEQQLYRIDHYLAKEMAQNIIAFRGQNAIFRHLWNKDAIEKIDIVATERIGIEGRGGFYEQTGALRDFVQNHLMQLLSLILMELPHNGETNDIPNRRVAALRTIEDISPQEFSSRVMRGQYEGYTAEVDNPGSTTETFMALTLFSNHPRWEGVPLRLITDKALNEQTTEIRMYFRQIHAHESNLLVLHIQPKEAVEIDLFAKKPGYEKQLEPFKLSFTYDASVQSMDAYERVIIDALRSDKNLFTTADEVLWAWQILQPIQDHWAFHTEDLRIYPKGSSIDDLLN